LAKERAHWFASLADGACYRILDHVPGVNFFAKDRTGRTMFASRGILERYGMRDESEMLGLTDFDLNPGSMAEGYVRDDARLLTGKIKQIERLELWFDLQGMPDWFVVTKLPLLDRRGHPQGVIGVLRRAEENEMRLPLFQTVAQAVKMIRQEYARVITIEEVATSCGQSLRQLQRRFRAAFGITPQEFLLKTRVLAAAQLLEETTLSSNEIALRCGFGEASAFTQHFRKRTGCTPLLYRRNKHARPPERTSKRRRSS
jgi:AraC-like DNA-binding protein